MRCLRSSTPTENVFFPFLKVPSSPPPSLSSFSSSHPSFSLFVISLGGFPADRVCHGNRQQGNRPSHLHFLTEWKCLTEVRLRAVCLLVCVCAQTEPGCTKLSAWIRFKHTAMLPTATGLHFMVMRGGLRNRLLSLFFHSFSLSLSVYVFSLFFSSLYWFKFCFLHSFTLCPYLFVLLPR